MIRALSKPLPHKLPRPNPQRLPKGKAVSIGIGFRCDLGIVLCSDTQITWEGRHKAYESKLFYSAGIDWTMASVYAGDPHLWKSFGDKFLELAKPFIGQPVAAQKLRDVLETALCCFDELDGNPLALTMLVGFVIPNKEIKLVKSEGKVVGDVSRKSFDYVGCGDSSLLRYLTPITADADRWPTISQALYAGTYWVLQAKRWVEDCGGDTDAIVLHWNGTMHKRSPDIHNWEQHLLGIESDISEVMKTLGNAEMDETEVENRLASFCQRIREERALCLRGL